MADIFGRIANISDMESKLPSSKSDATLWYYLLNNNILYVYNIYIIHTEIYMYIDILNIYVHI